MKNELQRKYKINFPAFEIAHSIYWKKANHEFTRIPRPNIYSVRERMAKQDMWKLKKELLPVSGESNRSDRPKSSRMNFFYP
jgi:hypothetical protein